MAQTLVIKICFTDGFDVSDAKEQVVKTLRDAGWMQDEAYWEQEKYTLLEDKEEDK